MRYTYKQLEKMQRLPLANKINVSRKIIQRGFELSKHNVAIAFSGGKDSTVLWHLIRETLPDAKPYVIFGNTGVEYPESLKFARKLGAEWGGDRFVEARPAKTEKEGLKYDAQREVLEWLIETGHVGDVLKPDGKLKSTDALERAATPEMWLDFRVRKLVWPAGTIMSYWWCVDQYGWPLLGKAASKLAARRINIDCFLRFSKSESDKAELLSYYDLLRNVKMSQMCCTILKKEPSERVQAELDIDVIFKGLMAAESRSRETNFLSRGFIFESSRDHCAPDPFYHINPLSHWTDDDIWQYINLFAVPYGPLYDMGWTDAQGVEHKIKRNGCMGCGTDLQFPNNHMATLRRTHPSQWKAIMRHGMAKQMQDLRIYRANGMPSILDVMESVDQILESRPCAFDSIDKLIMADNTFSEYDSEFDAEMEAM